MFFRYCVEYKHSISYIYLLNFFLLDFDFFNDLIHHDGIEWFCSQRETLFPLSAGHRILLQLLPERPMSCLQEKTCH